MGVGMNTRRGVLAAITGAGIALAETTVEARRRKKNKKNKKKDKKKQDKTTYPKNASVSGVGPGLTSTFLLAKGIYRARATVVATSSTGGLFFADLYNSRGLVDYVFIENPENPGTYQFEDIAQVPADGTYFFHIEEAEGSWSISLNRM